MRFWKAVGIGMCLAPTAALAQDASGVTPEQISHAYDWICSNRDTVEPILEAVVGLSVVSHLVGIVMTKSGITKATPWLYKLYMAIRAVNGAVKPPPAVIAQEAGAILSDPVKGPAVLAAIKDDPIAKKTVVAGALATSALSKP